MKRILFSLALFFTFAGGAYAAPEVAVLSPTQGQHMHAADVAFEVEVSGAIEIPLVTYQIGGFSPANCDSPLAQTMEYSRLNKTSFANESYRMTSGSYDVHLCVVVDGFVYLPMMRSFTVQNLQFQSLNVTLEDELFLQFTHAVDESTLTGNVILAKDSEVISLEVSRISDTLYQLSPKYELNRAMKYDFIVRTGVTDLNGRKFDNSSMSGYQEFQMTLFGA